MKIKSIIAGAVLATSLCGGSNLFAGPQGSGFSKPPLPAVIKPAPFGGESYSTKWSRQANNDANRAAYNRAMANYCAGGRKH